MQQNHAEREEGERRYNARAVVPDYPDIFARWACESAQVRAHLSERGRARLGLAYGEPPAKPWISSCRKAGPWAP